MTTTTTKHPRPKTLRPVRTGSAIALDLDNLHFIGWELAFAFDRHNIALERNGHKPLTQTQFARKCKVCVGTVSRLFTGRTQEPRLSTIIKIGKQLGYVPCLRRVS